MNVSRNNRLEFDIFFYSCIQFLFKFSIEICDKNDTDSDDDEFYTPDNNLSGSDDEMDLPDEGPDIFLCK